MGSVEDIELKVKAPRLASLGLWEVLTKYIF
jgi:hypothetical protein